MLGFGNILAHSERCKVAGKDSRNAISVYGPSAIGWLVLNAPECERHHAIWHTFMLFLGIADGLRYA
jgi:hypothetical protein